LNYTRKALSFVSLSNIPQKIPFVNTFFKKKFFFAFLY